MNEAPLNTMHLTLTFTRFTKRKLAVLAFVVVGCRLLAAVSAAETPAAPAAATFYFIDVGLGNATLIVTPTGESLLLDTGTAQSTGRVLETLMLAGLKRIDYLLVTHYHEDHFGAAAELAAKVPIGHFIDHGASVESGKDDAWWEARRGPWFKPGKGKAYDEAFAGYVKAREKGEHIVAKPGDKLPISGLTVQVVSAGGTVLTEPLPGAGRTIETEPRFAPRKPDDAEDAQSIGVLITLGKFRFAYLGDLTWNESGALFSPKDKIGRVDAYVVTHHAQSLPRSMGDYYWGLSACPPCELKALQPRVAILSLGALGHRHGTGEALKVVRDSERLEDLWQTEKVIEGGESGQNSPDDFIAFIGRRNDRARFLKLIAQPNGSFTMTNSRTGFTKNYPVRR